MTESPTTTDSGLSPAISRLLAAVRRGIRAYIWVDGLAAAALLLGAGFWISLGLDWMLEPPAWLRAAMLVVVALAVVWLVYRLILRRAFVRLPDHQMALVVERRYREFEDSLITSVELAGPTLNDVECDRQMLATTRDAALENVRKVRVGAVLNTRPLARRVALAFVLVASVAVFGAMANDAFGVWVRRSLLLSGERWPRKTHLTAEGFGSGRSVKVALGADYDLVVNADATIGRVVPQSVEVQYRDGSGRREPMSREGDAVVGLDQAQKYTHTFKSVLSSIDFYILGGDDRLGPLRIEAVESPTIGHMTLSCRFPDYMRRESRDVQVSGVTQLPLGTEVTIHGESNKDLVRVQIDEPAEHGPPVTHIIELAAARPVDQEPRSFSFDIPRLEGDKLLLFTLFDTDGVRSREPVRLTLAAIADAAPQVDVQLRGIGRQITPSAKLPAAGSIADDYGVAKAWFEYRIDEKPPAQRAIKLAESGATEVAVRDTLSAAELGLAPKQTMRLEIRAADTFNLTNAPNQGASQAYMLDIVTPDEFIKNMETRELALRRWFDTIIEELTETRNTLTRLDFTDKPPMAPTTKTPGEDEASKPLSADEQLGRRRSQAERALQDAERNAQQTLEVAGSFMGLYEELVNNEIDAEERKSRLKTGIAEPLAKIGGESEALLIEKIRNLQRTVANQEGGPPARDEAVAEADRVLVEMEEVRGRMMKLEDFNEILNDLRDVIEAQREVGKRTKETQAREKRKLLEEE